ncbi:hypothetical protein [Oleiharenicola sp. Vm1]|uniref:hypothetical protein n=1 Tax=Oleiharenicola sp. Vm1 TaxID=3398393 RepID=UPI0039F50F20
MRHLCLLLALAALALPRLEARGFLEFLLGRRDLEVITVTDATPAGRRLAPPDRAHPQYYLAVSLGFRDLGGAMGGIKEPPVKDVLRLISAELAKQGYLPATEKSPPATLMLAYTWGTLNADTLRPDPDAPSVQLNRAQIVGFLGGRKLGFDSNFFDPLTAPITGLQTMSYDARNLYEIASEDFYIVVVSAYDLAALRQKKKELLWMTRIATPSLGFDLGESMPAMLAIAGPHLGRETARPVWMSATEKFKPNVKLGELQLIEYLGDAPLPVVEHPEASRKPKR